jgi:short subunit fatty acids transporter
MSGHVLASSPKVRKILQASAAIIDRSGDTAGGFRIVALYALANALQIFRCRHRPANLY